MSTGAATQRYAARFLLDDMLERGVVNALTCPVYLNGALVAPTESGSTVTIWDGSTKRVDAAAVTVTDKVAGYNYTPAATIDWGENWRIEWSLVYGGVNKPFRNDAQLVRHPLSPVLTDADLFRRHRALDPNSKSPLSTVQHYGDYRDDAWVEIQDWLIKQGNRAHLVLNPSALRKPHLFLTLALIFEDFRTSMDNELYGDRAKTYLGKYHDAIHGVRLRYAAANDDTNGGSQQRKGPDPTVWLC